MREKLKIAMTAVVTKMNPGARNTGKKSTFLKYASAGLEFMLWLSLEHPELWTTVEIVGPQDQVRNSCYCTVYDETV